MENAVRNFDAIKTVLDKSADAFIKIVESIRVNYFMDEFFNGNNELKFRRSGKHS